MSTLVELFKQFGEFVKHSQAIITVIGIGGGGIAGWYITRRNYKTGTFRSQIEFIGVEPELQDDGTYLVDFSSWGDQYRLGEIVTLPNLEKRVVQATKKTRDGFLKMPQAIDHRRLMGIFEDHLSGRDPRANQEALEGIAVRKTDIIFAPTYFCEEEEDCSMVRVFIIATKFAVMMANTQGAAKFVPRHERHADFMVWAQRIAARMDTAEQKSGDTAYIWGTTIKTSYGGNTLATGQVAKLAAE